MSDHLDSLQALRRRNLRAVAQAEEQIADEEKRIQIEKDGEAPPLRYHGRPNDVLGNHDFSKVNGINWLPISELSKVGTAPIFSVLIALLSDGCIASISLSEYQQLLAGKRQLWDDNFAEVIGFTFINAPIPMSPREVET